MIGELGPQLFNVEHRPGDAARARGRRHPPPARRRRPGSRAPTATGSPIEIADDILGHGPLERLLADDTVTEIMVNGPYDIWIERAGPALPDERHASTTSRTCAGSSTRSSPRSAAASTSRRRWSTRACPTAAASTRSSRRSRSRGPLVTIRKFARNRLDARRHDPARDADDRDDRVPRALRPGAAEHPHLGRHRHRKDDAAERALGGDPGRRADRHDRGRRRAPAQPAARAAARVAARRTSRARARSRSATSCATACACAPTGSSSARSAAPRRSTCSRR